MTVFTSFSILKQECSFTILGEKDIDLSRCDAHVITGCLKMYLRELPEPLLTFEFYEAFLGAEGLLVKERMKYREREREREESVF